MTEEQLVRKSKYLSKHLRHSPESIGLTLQEGGWVDVDDLLAACARNRFALSRAELDEVVENNSKKRFSFDESGTRIRANQGHSVDVDLQLSQTVPPDVLYHGTGHKTVALILGEGISKMNRHHVHLSADVETATRVGARHGRPVVLRVDAKAMSAEGYSFYVSDNGVWLVESVPAAFLSPLTNLEDVL
ncbi:MAG: RNA 2'-phosphotransferase [Armatimonadota bacterium]